MSNFKKHDRVRLVNINDPYGGTYSNSASNTVGNVGTVTEAYNSTEDEISLTVRWDNGKGSNSYQTSNLSYLNEDDVGSYVGDKDE